MANSMKTIKIPRCDRGVYLPTPEQIAAATAKIRAGWAEWEWRVRSVDEPSDRWEPPAVSIGVHSPGPDPEAF